MELKIWTLKNAVRYLGLGFKEFVYTNSFSIKRIKPNQKVYIPDDQQMIVKQSFTLEGELLLDGELVII